MSEPKKMLTEELAAAVLIILMVLLVTAQVLSRYLLHVSLSYTEEIVRYLFVWATFLGASAAVRKGRHLSISSGSHSGKDFFHRWVRRFKWAAAALFAGVLLVEGVRVTALQMTTGQTTAALGMSMWAIGLAAPVGALLILIRIVQAARRGDRS
jgi:C4-dicarboxylate transporter, DctQ subunit